MIHPESLQPELRTPAVDIDSVEHEARLQSLWETSPGIKGFFTTVDHKEIGIRYIVTAFAFLALGESRRWSSGCSLPVRI